MELMSRIRLAGSLALVAAVLALYAPVLHYPFLFDGISGIERNIHIKDPFDLATVWRTNPSRFLTFESFALNRWAGGVNPTGYHWVNNLIHAANTVILYILIGMLFTASRGQAKPGREEWTVMAAGFLAALLFAVHPLQTEAVTYVWQRSASMVTMFYLLSMVFYLRSALMETEGETGGGRLRSLYMGFSILFALAAMITKQTAVTLPLALALVDYFFISGLSLARFKERVVRLAPFIPMILIVPALTAMYDQGEVSDAWRVPQQMLSPWTYLLTQFNVLVHYLRLFFYPVGLNLDYDFPIAHSIFDSAGSLLILLAILLAGLWLSPRARMGGFGIVFFFLAHSVESSFYPIADVIFEHRMYMPMVGLMITLAWAMAASEAVLGRKGALALALAAIMAALALSCATLERNRVWASGEILWQDVIAKSPHKPRGYVNMMVLHRVAGNMDEAEKWLAKSLEVDPTMADGFHDLGVFRMIKGDLPAAELNLKKALELDPKRKFTLLELGKVYFRQGRYDEAGETFVKAINVDNRFFVGFDWLGKTLLAQGELAKAKSVYEKLLASSPGNPSALGALAGIHERMGNKEEAAHYARMATEAGFKPEANSDPTGANGAAMGAPTP